MKLERKKDISISFGVSLIIGAVFILIHHYNMSLIFKVFG